VNRTETIIAPATPPGEGGLAVIRISGSGALEALHKFFRPTGSKDKLESHRLYHGYLVDNQGNRIDEVMAVYMQPPRSYTCEEVVEIHCHGGRQIVRSLLDLYLGYGLRLAQPGEFTYRAFMNGRLDLSQAEAVSRLIHSRSETSRALALSQVEGRLSRAIHRFSQSLRRALVLIEAWIDFPEEELPVRENLDLKFQLSEIIKEIDVLLDTFQTGRAFIEGVSILLIGRPNSGKSSLLNALLGEERAIVTEIPGTTRDTLEEGLTIGGLPVRLVDTAGFRHSEDRVEMEGVRRAREKIATADLVLLVVDASQPLQEEDLLAYQACRDRSALLVLNKADLVSVPPDTSFCSFAQLEISAKTGQGLPALRETVARMFNQESCDLYDSVVITEKRHNDALLRCRESLERAEASIVGQMSLEFLALDVRGALDALGMISGETTTDDILNDIFSSFCIGK